MTLIAPVPSAPEKIEWQHATIEGVLPQGSRMKSFLLRLEHPRPFRAGQYMDVRLTAPDGYQAQRSYSITSSPRDPSIIELVIDRLPGGEVSSFFHDVAEVGDVIELRGPFGGPFTWVPLDGGPLLLVGGGSGVAPLMSMLRDRAERAAHIRALLLYSAQTYADVAFREELLARARAEHGFKLMLTLTRDPAERPGIRHGRIDERLIRDALAVLGPPQHVFVCGSNPFVATVSDTLVETGLAPSLIRTERYGG